ncbi:MAG TPA: hypothetical protein VGX92_20645 [Pyrinomonadaceae bacterium]|jgi:hypothetical protein|nr:hypothetical protein [Pyrinomonadaceae bacterium]
MRKFLLNTCSILLPFAFTVAGAVAQTPTQRRTLPKPTQTSSRIVAVEKYTDELDNYARLNPQERRFFVNTAETASGNWQEVGGEKEIENKSSAVVWMKKGKAVIALLSSQTMESSQKVTYYYRDNGTLAKVHSELFIKAGNMESVRDRSYDPKVFAILIRDFSHCADFETGQQKPCGDAAALEAKAIPIYMKTTELPFYALLKKP